MTDTNIKTVGFIGLGKMGKPIAKNILKAGYELTVFNRTADRLKSLDDNGYKIAGSPKEAALGADVVITCLMDDQTELNASTGENGLLAGLKPGGIHICTATISPSCSTKLAELHQANGTFYIAAPLFGRPDAAAAGTVLSYIAGEKEAVETCDKLFESYTGKHIYLGGDHGLVNSVKLAMNFALVSLVELFSQVYTFTEKSGIDPEFTEELLLTVVRHPVLSEYASRLRTRSFEPAAFTLTAGFKDVELMLQASSEVKAPLIFASAIREKFLTALADGMADKDWSAIYEVTRKNAGLS